MRLPATELFENYRSCLMSDVLTPQSVRDYSIVSLLRSAGKITDYCCSVLLRSCAGSRQVGHALVIRYFFHASNYHGG